MRIPSGTTDQYIYFYAVDSTDFTTPETGLSSFTVYRSRNGAAAAAFTTPTVNETDATNMAGVYELLLDEDMTIDAGDDEQEMVFHISHAGMAPVVRTITLFRPKITAGNTLGVESDGDLTQVNTLNGHTAQTADHTAAIAAIPTNPNTVVPDAAGTAAALIGTPVNDIAEDLEAFFQIALRSDASIHTDRAAYITVLNADEGTGAGSYVANLDSQRAIKASSNGIQSNQVTTWGHLTDIKGTGFAKDTHSLTDVLDDTNELQANQGNWITATSVTVSDKTGFALSSSGMDAVTLPANLITASSIAASALDGKGDWNTVTPDAAGTANTLLGVNGASLTAIPATVDWLDGGRLDLLLDAIKLVTDALGATAAANLAKSAGIQGIISFTVDTVTNTHTPTTTEFQADDITEATADHFNGRVVIWLTGTLAGQATDITDYAAVGGIGQFTVTALTEAPANNDTGIIV